VAVPNSENSVKKLRGSERVRPNVVIGRNAMKRFNYLKKQKEQASKAIGKAVSNDLRGKPADITAAYDQFLDSLSDLGVTIDENGIDFTGSLIDGSDTGTIRRIYNRITPSYSDAARLHDDKRFISKQIDYTKKAPLAKTLDDEAEGVIKELRSNINDVLRGMSDDYASANDQFAKAINPMVEFADIMGRRYDPMSERVDNYVGQELRKTITNYASANPMITALDNMDTTARSMGGNFDDDIMTQVAVNRELERMLGSFAPGSFQSNLQAGAELAIEAKMPGVVQTAKAVKEGLMFEAPAKEKLELINRMRKLVGNQ